MPVSACSSELELNRMQSVRLIAIDIDGTLLDSNHQVSDANIAALRHAHERGVEIALVTGRRHMFALPVAHSLGFGVTLISSDGAVTRLSDGSLFHRDLLPAEAARALTRHMAAFRGETVLIFDQETKGALVVATAAELNEAIRRWKEHNPLYLEFGEPLEMAIAEPPIQLRFCGTIYRMREAETALLASGLVDEITILRTQYEERDFCIVIVLNRACSKGHALQRWAEHRSIPRQEVMAIGDNYNDIEMLHFAGVPVIMANACNELKQNGWVVTLGNNHAGVAHAVKLILGM
jgi:Cof subfamily protein (haloacid dehalogenase superfamily)